MNDPHSFARRLRRIQSMSFRQKRMRALGRLLKLFDATVVKASTGAIMGYRLPSGEWFCRKIPYHSEAEAELAAARLKRLGKGLCESYRCHQCGFIHLTSGPLSTKNS